MFHLNQRKAGNKQNNISSKMNRIILLIIGHFNNADEENGMNNYLKSYKAFFESNAGGSFESNEILCLKSTSVENLKDIILREKADFGIIVLIGHGATKDDNQLFKLNKTANIKAGQLNLDIQKQIIIVESCRSLVSNIPTVDLTDKKPLFRDGGMVRNPIDRSTAKELYNKQIENSKPGISICFACSKGEEAHNFYFSNSILQLAFEWYLSSQNHLRILKLNELMFLTNMRVSELAKREKNENQNPEMVGVTDFPFSVSKF